MIGSGDRHKRISHKKIILRKKGKQIAKKHLQTFEKGHKKKEVRIYALPFLPLRPVEPFPVRLISF